MSVADLVAQARVAFGWHGDVDVSQGPRGALGQIWRVDVGSTRYALKEIFDEPPTESSIRVELDFCGRAAELGVRMPASHPDRDGHHLLTTPAGTWLRLYDWIDLRPVPMTAPETPQRIGELLATLHRCAPAESAEPNGGGPPDPWYDTPPAPDEWSAVSTSPTAWAQRLAECLAWEPELRSTVAPTDPARVVLCHRDLHPENVFVDPSGALVLVDWDDLGPAEPGRELARALFDWCCDDVYTDLDAVRLMVDAYLGADGPGVVTELPDFSMLVATRLNFLLSQLLVARDPAAQRAHREWARHEIDRFLPAFPTVRQLTAVLAVTRDCCQSRSPRSS